MGHGERILEPLGEGLSNLMLGPEYLVRFMIFWKLVTYTLSCVKLSLGPDGAWRANFLGP